MKSAQCLAAAACILAVACASTTPHHQIERRPTREGADEFQRMIWSDENGRIPADGFARARSSTSRGCPAQTAPAFRGMPGSAREMSEALHPRPRLRAARVEGDR